MSNEILRLLIENACKNGEISESDKELIFKKADQMGISSTEVQKMINDELEKSQNAELESGFIPLEDIEAEDKIKSNESVNKTESKFTNITPLAYQGAMSQVFKAKMYGKWIIIKRIKPEYRNNRQYRELFEREFENAFHLDHPNIVRLLDKGEDAQGPYYTMEFIDGRPLSEMIGEKGITNKKLVEKIAKQILDALSYVHKKQIFHRDLKPDNIYITYRGDNVKILDFGLASADIFDDTLAKAGTPRYAAPEQMDKNMTVDQRADIYSFGKIFFEMLTGSTDLSKISEIESDTYRYIVEKSTKQNPIERFHDCEDILEILKNSHNVTSYPIQNKKNKVKKTDSGINTKSKIPVIVISIIVITAILSLVYFFFLKNGNGKSDRNLIPLTSKNKLIAKADSLYSIGEYTAADSVYNLIKKKTDEVKNKIAILNKIVPEIKKGDEYFKTKNIAKAKEIFVKLNKEYPKSNEITEKLLKCEQIIRNADFTKLKPVSGSSSNKLGIADQQGNIIFDYQFDEVYTNYYMKNSIGLMPVKKNGKYGFISRSEDIIPCEYDTKPAAINMHGKGYYYLTSKSGKKYYLFTDRNGKPVIETK